MSTTNLVVLIIVLVKLVLGDHFDFVGQQKTRKTLNLAGFCTSSFLLGTIFGGAGASDNQFLVYHFRSIS
ncbi:hypothetical protein AERO8C_20592 [Aeromonas veronii]|uniref:Uncharacterized protein n=1 Tax=Aeromonas veronii TaxID=654 RepID=A0A653L3Q9_AERVE|nr:hypothetical protein AERO8C_20592 [Aeromonas veronii]